MTGTTTEAAWAKLNLSLDVLGAVMSGTGSAVFGIFADADSAAYAKRRLARDYAECFLTETIGRLEI